MAVLSRIFREPLLHFLAGGALLFLVFYIVNPNAGDEVNDPKRVVVDRDAILTFLQYRTKTFEPKIAATRFDAMNAPQRQSLIDDYVREEVLFREAKAFGLEKGDYIIRRRLVQKLDFISQGIAETASSITGGQLAEFYETNKAAYRIAPYITFTHVFFDAGKVGKDAAGKLATRKLAELVDAGVQFSNASRHGERFLYHLNYVERTPDFVASHFGPEMAEAVFAISPDERRWHGPFRSQFGSHLVMVAAKGDARIPPLSEVRGRVLQDLKRKLVRENKDKAVAAIIESYDVVISPALVAQGNKVAAK